MAKLLLGPSGKLLVGPGGKLLSDASVAAMRDCCCELIDCECSGGYTPLDCNATFDILPEVFYVDWYPQCNGPGNEGWIPAAKKLTVTVSLVNRAYGQYFGYVSYVARDGTPRWFVYYGACFDATRSSYYDVIRVGDRATAPTPYVPGSGGEFPPRDGWGDSWYDVLYWSAQLTGGDGIRTLFNGCAYLSSPVTDSIVRWRTLSPCVPDRCTVPVTALPAALTVTAATEDPYVSPQTATLLLTRDTYGYYQYYGSQGDWHVEIRLAQPPYPSVSFGVTLSPPRAHLPSGWSGHEYCDASGATIDPGWSVDCLPSYPVPAPGHVPNLPATGEAVSPVKQLAATDPDGVRHFWPVTIVLSWVP